MWGLRVFGFHEGLQMPGMTVLQHDICFVPECIRLVLLYCTKAPLPDYCINTCIQQQNKQGKQVLNTLCQACRVDHWRQVVFDKSGFTAAGYASVAKLVFKRGQWAGPAKQFNQDSPCHAGEV